MRFIEILAVIFVYISNNDSSLINGFVRYRRSIFNIHKTTCYLKKGGGTEQNRRNNMVMKSKTVKNKVDWAVYDNVFDEKSLSKINSCLMGESKQEETRIIDRFNEDTAKHLTSVEKAILSIIDGFGKKTESSRYIEWWWRDEWIDFEAHRDVSEVEAESSLSDSSMREFRCPNFAHVLYVDVDHNISAPTCIFKEDHTDKEEERGKITNKAENQNKLRKISKVSIIPAVKGRVLRFQGDYLHAVPQPVESYILETMNDDTDDVSGATMKSDTCESTSQNVFPRTDQTLKKTTSKPKSIKLINDEDLFPQHYEHEPFEEDDGLEKEGKSPLKKSKRVVVLFNTWSFPPESESTPQYDLHGEIKKHDDDASNDITPIDFNGESDDFKRLDWESIVKFIKPEHRQHMPWIPGAPFHGLDEKVDEDDIDGRDKGLDNVGGKNFEIHQELSHMQSQKLKHNWKQGGGKVQPKYMINEDGGDDIDLNGITSGNDDNDDVDDDNDLKIIMCPPLDKQSSNSCDTVSNEVDSSIKGNKEDSCSLQEDSSDITCLPSNQWQRMPIHNINEQIGNAKNNRNMNDTATSDSESSGVSTADDLCSLILEVPLLGDRLRRGRKEKSIFLKCKGVSLVKKTKWLLNKTISADTNNFLSPYFNNRYQCHAFDVEDVTEEVEM